MVALLYFTLSVYSLYDVSSRIMFGEFECAPFQQFRTLQFGETIAT